jgi:hypothetical protein
MPTPARGLRAAVQVQVVVAVAAVGTAAVGADQPPAAQQPQVVGDQVLVAAAGMLAAKAQYRRVKAASTSRSSLASSSGPPLTGLACWI